jgi:signal transduction histidine kinase
MDVTDRKVAEKALEQSRQLRFKDEFLSHVSHELRSPLTAIKQFTTILLDGLAGELNQAQREYEQIVLKNIQQLQSMIDDLLEVTRLESGKLNVEPERMSVSAAVTDALNTLQVTARDKGITLSFDLPPDLACAYADQTRVRQILIILLDDPPSSWCPHATFAQTRNVLETPEPRFFCRSRLMTNLFKISGGEFDVLSSSS